LTTLIVYATVHGTAEQCARRIAEKLDGRADVFNLKSGPVPSPAAYDRIIIGSCIYGCSVLKEIKDFCAKYGDLLLQKPLGIFFACFSDSKQDEKEYLSRNFTPSLIRHADPVSALGGAFYFTKLNFLERLLDRHLAKKYALSNGIPVPDGKTDFITVSEEKITAFAEKINRSGSSSGTEEAVPDDH
jgi:menaquinone-dependent protoporphyrinogen oxidase